MVNGTQNLDRTIHKQQWKFEWGKIVCTYTVHLIYI